MELKLEKPICFFDLETTGLSITKDRIVQIAIVKVLQDGTSEELDLIVNPEIEISDENAKIHGITNEIARTYPTFKEHCSTIISFIGDSDLAGYNSNKFDIPFLAEEFIRNDVNFDLMNREFVDIQNIFHKMEQRTLSAAYQFYCNQNLDNAHNALHDVRATKEILFAQIRKYDNLDKDISFLAKFSKNNNDALVDFAGRLSRNKYNKICYNFGKHKGKTVEEVNSLEPGYYGWMMGADFPLHTKECLKKEMGRIRDMNNQHTMEKKLNSLKDKFNTK